MLIGIDIDDVLYRTSIDDVAKYVEIELRDIKSETSMTVYHVNQERTMCHA